jgi:hypothetical protein
MHIYMGQKRAYSAKPSITSRDRCRASLPGLDLLLRMGAGGGRWGAASHQPHARSLRPNATQDIGTNPVPTDELSMGLNTSNFSKSQFLMATFFELQNLMWNGRCKTVHIVSTIESVKRTQLRCA